MARSPTHRSPIDERGSERPRWLRRAPPDWRPAPVPHRRFVANVRLHRSYLSDIAHRVQEQVRLRVADGDADLMPLLCKQLDDLVSNAAGAAKYGDQGHTQIPSKKRFVTMPDRGKFPA